MQSIKENIIKQLKALAQGKYFPWDWANNIFLDGEAGIININEYYKKIYLTSMKTIEEVGLTTKSLLQDEIEDEIVAIIKENKGEYIFDLTGLAKKYFVQVLMFLQDNGYNFSTFEIVNKTLSRDHGDLIHNLGPKYINYAILNQNKYKLSRLNINDAYLEDRYELLNHKISSWKEKVSDGNTDEVIKEIDKYISEIGNRKFGNQIKLISNKWNNLRFDRSSMNRETAAGETNKITNELIEFMDDLINQFKDI